MPDQDEKNRDVATNKLLNILRSELDDSKKDASDPSKPSDQDDNREFDSNELTRLFDQTVSGKISDVEVKDEKQEQDRNQDQVKEAEKEREQEKEPEQEKEKEEKDKAEEITESPDFTVEETDKLSAGSLLDLSEEDFENEESESDISETDESREITGSDAPTHGPFVEFINRFDKKQVSDEEDSSPTLIEDDNKPAEEELPSDAEADSDTESEEKVELLSFLDKQEDITEKEATNDDILSLKTDQESPKDKIQDEEKKDKQPKSFFDILDEYIATKNDDVVLPIKETDVIEDFDKPVPPAKEEEPPQEEPVITEPDAEKETVTAEEEKAPKSATQKVIYEDIEQEDFRQQEFLESEEDEDKVFEESNNSVTPAVKLKISEISSYINDRRKITVIETDEAGAGYLQAVPEGTKIKITDWGNINYWNFPKEATDEDKHKFALRSISRQIKHKKSYLTFFSHSRNYVTRIQTFQKLSNKETQEAIKWAVSKNLPFPDKKVEYDVKQISSDSVDDKNYLTLIAPQTQIMQQEKYFRDYGMNPRKISTVSALAAKAFRLNYPDYYKETAIIFYFGEAYSNLIFIKNHEFHYEREFGVGRKDLIAALNQEVNTVNGPKKLSRNDAIQLLDNFGFTRKKSSSIQTLGIDYSRYSIMIRPLAERIIMEISRSIDFYKKNFSLLADGDLFLVGPGAVIPGIVRFIEDQLGRKTSILNPMRTDIFSYKNKEAQIPDKMLPMYSLHLAAAYPDTDLNVISSATRSREVFIAGSKLSRILLIIFIVFAGIRTNDLIILRDGIQDKYKNTQIRWQNVSNASTEFMAMNQKENTMTRILNQVREDQYSTDRALSLMKLISNLTPAGVHLIDFQLGKSTNPGDKAPSDFVLKGYITRNPSVADIYLNNYLAKFKDTGFFQDVTLTTRDERIDEEMRRTFTITGVLKSL